MALRHGPRKESLDGDELLDSYGTLACDGSTRQSTAKRFSSTIDTHRSMLLELDHNFSRTA